MEAVRMRVYKAKTGLSLVELLVVMGMIAILTAVAIPTLARSGLFTSNKAALGARELFTLLRAAKVYATTHNIETAVVYGGALITDSETGECVPVADSIALARKIKRDEVIALIEDAGVNLPNADDVFIPLQSVDGTFRPLPNDIVVLPDLYRTRTQSNDVSRTGLVGVRLFDPEFLEYLLPRDGRCQSGDPYVRLDYRADGLPNSFPAHRFLPEGSIDTDGLPEQRLTVRLGITPEAEFTDRFYIDPNEVAPQFQSYRVRAFTGIDDDYSPDVFERTFPGLQQGGEFMPIDIDTTLELFVPTGRVKIVD